MTVDLLTATSAVLFLGLSLATWAAMPKCDREPSQLAGLACIVLGTLIAYCSTSLPLFTAGWALTVLPYWGWIKDGPRTALTAGTLVLTAGAGFSTMSHPRARFLSFAFLMIAAIGRKGIFPLHFWIPRGLERSSPLALMLLLNGHLGALLVLRFAIPMLPEIASLAISFLSILALFTALYSALVAVSESSTRRALGFLSVSQASFVLAGLENRSTEGITGALVHWLVVAAATTGLVCVYRGLEARFSPAASLKHHLGLGSHAPRLAVFFAICGLALVGLPGTLGFAAEDLLFHGSLESHPWLGITLPLATALNAITIYRMFSKLFMGRSAAQTPIVMDALPQERQALTAIVAFLIVGGIVPGVLVNLRTPVAERIVQVLTSH